MPARYGSISRACSTHPAFQQRSAVVQLLLQGHKLCLLLSYGLPLVVDSLLKRRLVIQRDVQLHTAVMSASSGALTVGCCWPKRHCHAGYAGT